MELKTIRIAAKRSRLHAEQRVVGCVVDLVGVVAIVGRQDRSVQALCDLEQLRVRPVLFRNTVILQLDKKIVSPKDVLQFARSFEAEVEVAVHQGLQDLSTEATCGCYQALAVLVQKLPVDPRLVVTVSYTHLTLPTNREV